MEEERCGGLGSKCSPASRLSLPRPARTHARPNSHTHHTTTYRTHSPMALDSKERVGPATGSTLSPKTGAHQAAGDASNAWAGGRGTHLPSSSSPLVVPHVRQMYNW